MFIFAGHQLSALFRVPLNVFVVVSLLTGVSARDFVLLACAVGLAISAITTAVVVLPRVGAPSLEDSEGDAILSGSHDVTQTLDPTAPPLYSYALTPMDRDAGVDTFGSD